MDKILKAGSNFILSQQVGTQPLLEEKRINHLFRNDQPLPEGEATMTATISYSFPDQAFWGEYAELWNNSIHKPVFKSPHYIQYLANAHREALAVFQFRLEGKLRGAAFFRRDGKVYGLLTDIKADHNFFVIHRDCSSEEIGLFFKNLLEKIKNENWTLTLRVQPLWASYIMAFVDAINASGLFWNVAKRSVCPILEEKTPQDLYDKLNASRELRYRVNKIKNQLKGEFEILTGTEDMDAWVEKFCDLHEKRWENTDSPSRYTTEEGRKFLKNCLSAWADDNMLVRFAVKVGGERIAFVICLIQQNSLVHHSTAYEDEYYKYSPGKALILVIAEWMQKNGLNVLDFGQGAEAYKYAYTNKELELNEISISPFSNLRFIFKVKLQQVVREKISENARFLKFYKEKIKPLTQRARE